MPWCAAKIIYPWRTWSTGDCNPVCQSQACMCINPCGDCEIAWVHWMALGQEWCDEECVPKWFETQLEYYCGDAPCAPSGGKCCICPEDPMVVDGPLQVFDVCPDS